MSTVKQSMMVVVGEPRVIKTDLGDIRFDTSLSGLVNGAYDEILSRLIDGKRVKRAWRGMDDRLHGSAVHSLSKENEEALHTVYPYAEWHYMKLAAYPVHVFVALHRGIPIAVAAPFTTRAEDVARKDKWMKQFEAAS
jgi:hypothetical protein